MLQLDPILPTYPSDHASKHTWERLDDLLKTDGRGFYRHPNLGLYGESQFPDFVVLTQAYRPLIVRVLNLTLAQLRDVTPNNWSTSDGHELSPLLELEDMVEALKQRLNRDRRIRSKVEPLKVLSLPLISEHAFRQAFPAFDAADTLIIWQDVVSHLDLARLQPELTSENFSIALSILQTAHAIGQPTSTSVRSRVATMGAAIRQLDNAIMLLDAEQQKAALNIPPGPQCIRGLAGTGKTVLLAMKAASIHSHYSNKKILVTFNTQSLYNQVRSLVTRFYRVHHLKDPDWDVLHVRHAWGGARRPGVYSDLCKRHGRDPMTLTTARTYDREQPFRACCASALTAGIQPYYDFVLVDEAQDFPTNFFELLWMLSTDPHCIYYAYDELQSLSSLEMPNPKDLFGRNADGTERFQVEGEYPGPIEKVLTLTKSYRCPREVLMLAHGVGLGIHGPRGPVQMLERAASWRALGYDPGKSVFEAGQNVVIERPAENSPNVISEVYEGARRLVTIRGFATRDEELQALADSVANDINVEGVLPQSIVIISLDSLKAKQYMSDVQRRLHTHGIASTIPGLVDDSAEFAEIGFVTLSTVYRAKGNEAPIIYIVAFERLWDYVGEVSYRNRAFTSISRSKGWVWISGIAPQMTQVETELGRVDADLPFFRFVFPDMTLIQRRLDPSETTRRKVQVSQARRSIRDLEEADLDALAASLDAEQLQRLEDKLRKVREVRGETE
jgi:superfamily I DNA and RNA helicase